MEEIIKCRYEIAQLLAHKNKNVMDVFQYDFWWENSGNGIFFPTEKLTDKEKELSIDYYRDIFKPLSILRLHSTTPVIYVGVGNYGEYDDFDRQIHYVGYDFDKAVEVVNKNQLESKSFSSGSTIEVWFWDKQITEIDDGWYEKVKTIIKEL